MNVFQYLSSLKTQRTGRKQPRQRVTWLIFGLGVQLEFRNKLEERLLHASACSLQYLRWHRKYHGLDIENGTRV